MAGVGDTAGQEVGSRGEDPCHIFQEPPIDIICEAGHDTPVGVAIPTAHGARGGLTHGADRKSTG
eukprot:5584815-Ditylum_brightwellii.AAC.1